MTVNARSRLIGLLRGFVEVHLCGVVSWDDCVLDRAVPQLPLPSGRRNPAGPWQDIATIRFGDYEVTARSPTAHPPLGAIEMRCPDKRIDGVLDETVFKLIGTMIRKRGMRNNYGARQSSSAVSGEWGSGIS